MEWCGIGHQELCTSFTPHLHSWCGMVWHRTLRTVHIFHLTPTQLVWNGVVQDIKSCAHLSPHTYTAGVEWCGIGHQELCTSFTSHLHSWCGMVWYRTSRAVHIFHLTPTQLVWNGVVQDIKSCAHLSPHTYTAGVEWCGIGHQELCTSFTSHLHSWCGMVWYRTSRAVHIFHLTPTQLVWNGVVQDIKSCAHLSPHTYTAGVEWCGTGHQELCTSFTSHLHSWCGMVWYRTSRAVHIFHLTPTQLVWNGVVKDIKSCAHLSPHTYTAGVEWCGTGHQELCTSFTSHLHSWCGMVWYRTSRAVHIFHLTPTQLVWNGVVQDIKSCAHLSLHTYTAGVEWCGTGHQELCTSFTSHLHSWCGMVWYRTSRAVHIFHLTPTQLVWNGVV